MVDGKINEKGCLALHWRIGLTASQKWFGVNRKDGFLDNHAAQKVAL